MRGLIFLSLSYLCGSACGSNMFKAIDPADPAEEALAAMDNQKPDQAIDILKKGLAKSPEDWILVSLLASAKAQKAGVDTTDIALNMATKTSDSDANGLTALFAVLPAASSTIISLLAESTALLATIPSDSLVDGDIFKISIFNTALTALQAKLFDADGDGKFTIEELANLDEAAAINILSSLLNAESAASIYQTSGSNGDATSSVSQIRTQIDAQSGATQAEKLKNFLGTSRTTP